MKESLSGSVENRKLRFDAPHYAAHVLDELEGKRFEMTISVEKRKHTDPQRKYYFAVIVEMVYAAIRNLGNEVYRDDVHEFLKNKFLTKDLMGKGGEILGIYSPSLSRLSKEAMMDYIDAIIRWSAEFLGLVIPDADPAWRTKKGK